MAKSKSVIITGAATGGIHPSAMSPYLPIAPARLAEPVARIRRFVEHLSLNAAAPDEARTRPALKGGDRLGF